MLSSDNKILQNYWENIDEKLRHISWPLWGILKYVWNICEDFFWITSQVDKQKIDIFLKNLHINLWELDIIESQILELQEADATFKKFYLDAISLSRKKIQLFEKAVYIEAQKWGFEISQDNVKNLLKEINVLQDEIYWPEVSSNQIEVKEILESFSTLYQQNNSYLSEEEKKLWKDFIWNSQSKNSSIPTNIDINISSKNKKAITQKILHMYWLFDWKITIEKTNWSVRVNWEKKELIFPKKRLEGLSTKKFLQLIDHEIWVHILRTHNSDQTIHKKLEWYLESEEGFASLVERLFDENINDITYSSTDHHHKTFLAEQFWWEKYKIFLTIYLKLANPTASPEEIEKLFKTAHQRSKRFVSYDFPWANRKDVSYSRWLFDIISYLQQEENREWFIHTFYQAKSSLKNMEDAAKVAKLFPEAKQKYPLWIGKIVYKKLLGNKIFLTSLQEEDFRFQEIEKLKFSTKRKVVEILQNIRWKKQQ